MWFCNVMEEDNDMLEEQSFRREIFLNENYNFEHRNEARNQSLSHLKSHYRIKNFAAIPRSYFRLFVDLRSLRMLFCAKCFLSSYY